MKFKLTAAQVAKIVNDITLNGSTNKEVVEMVMLPHEVVRCMEIILTGPIYMEDLQEIAKAFDDADPMFDTTASMDIAMYITPGEKFFEEGGAQ